MIIEVRQAGFVNKGAELMLYAVIQKIREQYPHAKITMAPTWGGSEDTYEKMKALNLYPKAWAWKKGIDIGRIIDLIPRKKIIEKIRFSF